MGFYNLKIRVLNVVSYLMLERVDLCLKLFVFVWFVEESQVDDIAGVLERKRGLLVSGLTQVDPVDKKDLVTTPNLSRQICRTS